jgi:hypothetical protein
MRLRDFADHLAQIGNASAALVCPGDLPVLPQPGNRAVPSAESRNPKNNVALLRKPSLRETAITFQNVLFLQYDLCAFQRHPGPAQKYVKLLRV